MKFGGMGVVLAARHIELGQPVAIKFMHAHFGASREAAERFLREARAAVALTSEHVAKVIDVGRGDGGEPYMVMEYLAGEDLARVLRGSGPMPVPVAVNLVLQTCDALAEAHALGIIHRDLKPANLFVTTRRDGTPLVKVLDFGISKAMTSRDSDPADNLTASGMVMGSPGYMSPEQVRSSRDVDMRADVWSLGVILYELLTGISPFLGDTMADTFAKIITDVPIPSPRQCRAELPAGLSRLIMRCLERRLEGRTASVVALAMQLAEFAPPDAAPLVDRIRRMALSPSGSVRRETLLAPVAVGGSTLSAPADGGETGPAWLRSSSSQPGPRPRRHVAGIVALIAFLGLGIGLAVLLGYRNRPVASQSPALAPALSGLADRASVGVPAPSAQPTSVAPSTEAPERTTPPMQALDAGHLAGNVQSPAQVPRSPPPPRPLPTRSRPLPGSPPPSKPNEPDLF